MKKSLGLVSAAGVGAGLMYFCDPDRGRRRRALLRDKAVHMKRIAGDAAGKTQRDIRNHLRGAVAEIESLCVDSGPVSNNVLEARVRSKLGRVVSHPHAIGVKAVDGLVILTGHILAPEVLPLLDSVIITRGVKNIESYLEAHDQAGDISALQGGRTRRREGFGPLKTHWSPATRLLATAAGGGLAFYGFKRRDVSGTMISSIGLGIAARALTNCDFSCLLGIDGRDVEKTDNLEACLEGPVPKVSEPQPAMIS